MNYRMFNSGQCHCTSKLSIKFWTRDGEVIFYCMVAISGNGPCKKTYLRAPLRKEVGEKLTQGTVDVYRSQLAEALMEEGDPEPPHIPKPSVLRMAKSEYRKSQFHDPDPVRALSLMARQLYPGDIHFVSEFPFAVHYWTNHQKHVYCPYAARQQSCIFIDATGSIFTKFLKTNNERTHNLFLYILVINCPAGQFSVGQMISEAHDTNSILNFWMNWLKYGFAPPLEVVMDSSRALMTATITALTPYKTIDNYCKACISDNPPKCYIRIDVAHFIKMYATFLKNSPRPIKVFYMACIGCLIESTSIDYAEELLENIFMVALSPKSGNLPTGHSSPCKLSKSFLKDLITGKTIINLIQSSHYMRRR